MCRAGTATVFEFKVTQQALNTRHAIRKACEEYALGFIDTQREQFKRLGVLGEWDNPPHVEPRLRGGGTAAVRRLGEKDSSIAVRSRFISRQAEVEYQDHVSQSVYVKFPIGARPTCTC